MGECADNSQPIDQASENQKLHTAQGTRGKREILSGKPIGQGLKCNVTAVLIKFSRNNSYEQVQGIK